MLEQRPGEALVFPAVDVLAKFSVVADRRPVGVLWTTQKPEGIQRTPKVMKGCQFLDIARLESKLFYTDVENNSDCKNGSHYLGFTPNRHEGKLMGVAALGHERRGSNPWPERLSRVLRVNGGSYEVDPVYTRFGSHSYAERFTDALADYITGFGGINERFTEIQTGLRGLAAQ